MNSRRLNRSNCISVPASQGRGLQDIELARISQQASVSLAELLNQSISYALRMSWRRSVPKMMVSDNFLDQLIGHRLHESVKGASRHRQLVGRNELDDGSGSDRTGPCMAIRLVTRTRHLLSSGFISAESSAMVAQFARSASSDAHR